MSESENPQLPSTDMPRPRSAVSAPPARLGIGRWSVRARLLTIVIALVVPLNAMMFIVLANLVRAADDSQRTSLLYSARSVAAGLDAELGKYVSLGSLLALSPSVQEDRIADFEAEARRAFTSAPEAWVVLSDAAGQQLINTGVVGSAPLPKRQPVALDNEKRAFETGKTVISDVYLGPARKEWIVAIDIPVFRGGQPFRSVSIVIPSGRFVSLFNAQEMPRNWLAGIMDTQGRYIARVPDQETTVGQDASQGWRATIGKDGVSEFASRSGEPVVNANAHPKLARWTVGIGVLKSRLEAAAARAVAWATASGAAISILSLLLALALARRITQPIARLERAAANVMSDPTVHFESSLPEFDRFWVALKRAASERAFNERMVRDSERRLRLASAAAHFGAHEFDPSSGFGVLSPEAYEVLGMPADAPVQAGAVFAAVHPEDRERVRKEIAAIPQRVGPYEIECRILRGDGSVRWVLDRGEALGPLDATTGLVARVAGVVLDITERKKAEERNILLMREVSHRAKNMLSVVQAIARRTAANSGPEFIERFEQRIQSLAANQDLLIENAWRGVVAEDLVRTQLLHFADLVGRRIRIKGPNVRLTPEAAQGVGMALHELVTNAAKYGALSDDKGSLDIFWRLDGGAFEIAWVESGGPPVSPPGRVGFGTTVMSHLARTSVGGAVDLEYARTGLSWRLRCPAENAVEQTEPPSPG